MPLDTPRSAPRILATDRSAAYLRELQQLQSRRGTRGSSASLVNVYEQFYTIRSSDGLIWGTSSNTLTLAYRKKVDANAVKAFIASGCHDDIQAFLSESGKLGVYGSNIYDSELIFVIDGDKLYAREKRIKHIKSVINKLAKREELELILSENDPEFERTVGIAVWVFGNSEDVDDSELVRAEPLVNREMDFDSSEAYRVRTSAFGEPGLEIPF